MAALTTGSWTIAYRDGNRYNSTTIMGRKREVRLKLTLTTGESPSTGVPLPPFGALGLVRYVDGISLENQMAHAVFTTARGRALVWQYNVTGHKLKPYQLVMASGTGTTSGGRSIRAVATTLSLTGDKVFYVTARGW